MDDLVTIDQQPIHTHRELLGPSESETDHTPLDLPETSVLVGMESYASIEFGVANLEIMYQERLKCIAMTSKGWRCPMFIQEE